VRVSTQNLIGVPSAPLDAVESSFPAPWAARAFAMARTLSIAGHFSLADWAQALGRELAADQHRFASQMPADLAYYRCWVNALESLLQGKGLLSCSTLRSAVAAAAANWPHPDHCAHLEPIAVSPAQT
jgi:nitrile hydratase accessory protein